MGEEASPRPMMVPTPVLVRASGQQHGMVDGGGKEGEEKWKMRGEKWQGDFSGADNRVKGGWGESAQ